MELPLDVWGAVFMFLDQHTAGSLSRVSHEFRDLGVRRLLAHGVEINSSQFNSLHCFMAADPLWRYPLLRKLILRQHYTVLDVNQIPLLIDVLEGAKNLRDLTLISCNGIFRAYPSIIATFASLRLERFISRQIDLATLTAALSTIGPSLTEVELEFTTVADISPMRLLAPYQLCLEKIAILGPYVNPNGSHQFVTQYPTARTLVWRCAAFCQISALIFCFPNLRELTFDVEPAESFRADKERARNAKRALNLQAQSEDGGRRWDSLDYLSGRITHLHALAVQTRVKHMHVTNIDIANIDLIPEVLATSPPELLSAEVVAFTLETTSDIDRIVVALGHLADSATMLLLDFWVGGELETDILVDKTIAALASFRSLADISLVIHTPTPDHFLMLRRTTKETIRPRTTPATVSASILDLDSVAARFKDAVQTLKSIHIWLTALEINRRWQIVKSRDGTIIVEL